METEQAVSKSIPTLVIGNSDWTHISLGDTHTCSIRNDGELFCWGGNGNGELGDGTYGGSSSKYSPVRIGINYDWTHIELGGSHTCSIRGGELFCWGDNRYGQLGDGTSADKNTPTLISF